MSTNPSASRARTIHRDEPVALAGAVAALGPAVQAFLAAFHIWEPDAAQLAAINGLVAAVILLLARWARAGVTPMHLPVDPDFLDQLAAAAYADVEGVDEVEPGAEDLHALDVPHGGE